MIIRLVSVFRYQHENIVTLYGYAYSNTDLCLVYQYLVNGSLEDRLMRKVSPLWYVCDYCGVSNHLLQIFLPISSVCSFLFFFHGLLDSSDSFQWFSAVIISVCAYYVRIAEAQREGRVCMSRSLGRCSMVRRINYPRKTRFRDS